jgi:4-amino-4-deoxy-L-arabinose transferase-like glycosyltransferase
VVPVLAAAASAGWKTYLLARHAFPFNADEAVVGLMARHILSGARPLFFYGQAYLGSLDAYLVAGAFRVFGESILAIRIVQVALYAGTVATTVALAQKLIRPGWPAISAGLLMAFPTVLVTLYSTVSLGGYGEALFLGNLLLILVVRAWGRNPEVWVGFLAGLLAGVGFWIFPLTIVVTLPVTAAVGVAWHRAGPSTRRSIAVVAFGLGALVGAFPWWGPALRGGLMTQVSELFGSAIAGATPDAPADALASHLSNLVLFGPSVILGFRPPWSVQPLIPILIPLALVFWSAVVYHSLAPRRDRALPDWGRRLLLGVGVAVFLGFLLTPFGADPSGRYFMPLAVPLALLAADLLERIRRAGRGWAAHSILAGLLGFQVLGTISVAEMQPPGITTQFDVSTQLDHTWDGALISFLQDQNETRGYSTYWVSYPIAFESREDVILVPALPYHADLRYSARDNRYPPYAEEVARSPRVAYVAAGNEALETFLRTNLGRLGLAWHEERIGGYLVFYGLSRHVAPAELGVGDAGP